MKKMRIASRPGPKKIFTLARYFWRARLGLGLGEIESCKSRSGLLSIVDGQRNLTGKPGVFNIGVGEGGKEQIASDAK